MLFAIDIPLQFKAGNQTKLFYDKNNKTLREIIQSDRYKSLQEEVQKNYSVYFDKKIGDFLKYLDETGNDFYKKFLNRHGDETYSIFLLKNLEHHLLRGVYCFYLDGELKYIGRCRDMMKKCINNGYGKITPTNCFKHGQSTNCKVNALITKYGQRVTLKLIPMKSIKKIEKLEKRLIRILKPEWNNRL